MNIDEIIKNVQEKHHFTIDPEILKHPDIHSLIRYSLHIGYNEGYMDHSNRKPNHTETQSMGD